ncbi:MAG: FGGY family carbohydrate kinase [Clostridiales bacterium]|nr:FGGY family carbohydrate kinase [Clostridiales bacterium]
MDKYLLGVDVGTTGTKAMVFGLSGEAFGTGYEEYICDYPRPNWVEQDAAHLASAVRRVVREAVKASGVPAEAIVSLAVSAQRDCLLLIDSEGTPLKMISWLDNRAGEQVCRIERELGADEFYRLTGLPLSTAWILPKIMWVQENDAELWAKTARVAQLHDFILHSLGADDYYNDEPDASLWGFFDTDNVCWLPDLMEKFDIESGKLPVVKQPGTKVGHVSAEVSAETGLSESTLLCIGGGDQNCASAGAGVVRPGLASVSLGTGGMAIVFLDRPFRDPQGKGIITINTVHGNWQIEGLQNGSAGIMRWFRDQIALYDKTEAEKDGEDAYERIGRLVEASKPGTDGLVFLPFLASANTPRYDPDARGTLVGLSLIHTRGDIARAVMEGITLDQKDILTSIREAGVKVDRIRIMGGATRSDLWNQLQADCYGVSVETLKITDAAVMGAAICAGVGAGLYPSIPAAADALVRVDRTYVPSPEMAKFYDESYRLYVKTYEALSGKGGVFERVAERQRNS